MLTYKHFLSPSVEIGNLDSFFMNNEDNLDIAQAYVDALYARKFSSVENCFVPKEFLSKQDADRAFTLHTLLSHTDFSLLNGGNEQELAENFLFAVKDCLEELSLEEAAKPDNILRVLNKFQNNQTAVEEMMKSNSLTDMFDDGDEGEEEESDEDEESSGEKGGQKGNKRTPEKLLSELSEDVKEALSKLSLVDSYNFNVDKQRIFVEDPAGPYLVDTNTGTVVNEVLSNPFATLDEEFAYKTATSSFDNKTRYKVIEQKQSVILLIDDSGSMDRKYKRSMVLAVMLHLIQKMLDDKLDLYIGLFEWTMERFDKITKENYKKYFNDWTAGSGGTTQVGEVIENLQKQIESGTVFGHELNPSSRIIVVNDGQDYINPHTKLIAPVNAVSLELDNPALRELCESSGGIYHHYIPTDIEAEE